MWSPERCLGGTVAWWAGAESVGMSTAGWWTLLSWGDSQRLPKELFNKLPLKFWLSSLPTITLLMLDGGHVRLYLWISSGTPLDDREFLRNCHLPWQDFLFPQRFSSDARFWHDFDGTRSPYSARTDGSLAPSNSNHFNLPQHLKGVAFSVLHFWRPTTTTRISILPHSMKPTNFTRPCCITVTCQKL